MRSARQVSQQQESAPSDSDNDDITNSTPTADEVMDALAKALNAHDDLSDSIKDFSSKNESEILDQISRSEDVRSEEHTSELQSLMRISYAVFCLKKKKTKKKTINTRQENRKDFQTKPTKKYNE